MNRRNFTVAVLAAPLAASLGAAAEHKPRHAVLYKNPSCECCGDYTDYLRKHGYLREFRYAPPHPASKPNESRLVDALSRMDGIARIDRITAGAAGISIIHP